MNGELYVQMMFNPQNCPLTLLDKTLTANRRKLADNILQRVRNGKGGSHHELLIGSRGSGKTHILSFIYKTLLNESGKKGKLKIIKLSEEERGLTSLLDFLIACLRACGLSQEEISERIMQGDVVMALSVAEELFHSLINKKPTLIFVENLGDILNGFEEKDLLELRGFFQTHPNISMLASSTMHFKKSSKPDHPFYGFFNIHGLEQLDRTNSRLFLKSLAEVNEKKDLAKELEKEEAQVKVDVIYDLTGGNHRLLSMLANSLDAEGFAELVKPFVKMVDRELTPYYQQRLDRLTPQQNKILRVIADHHGKALPVKDIARFSFLTSQVVSRQLHDLNRGMFIRRNSIGRESYYELNEPLLRVVLDMKEGRDKPLPIIVSFLRSWHAAKQLKKLKKTAPHYVRPYYVAALKKQLKLEHEKMLVSEDVPKKEDKQFKELSNLIDLGTSQISKREFNKSHNTFDNLIDRLRGSNDAQGRNYIALAYDLKGKSSYESENYPEALGEYEKALKLKPYSSSAKGGRICALFSLGQTEKAVAALEEIIDILADSPDKFKMIYLIITSGFMNNERILKLVIEPLTRIRKESIVIEVLFIWLRLLFPMNKDGAKQLEKDERVLNRVLKNIPEAQPLLQVLNAVRRDALGDKKALMDIPLEWRRLIEKEKNNG